MDTMDTIPHVASGTGGSSDKGGIDTGSDAGSDVGSDAGIRDRALPMMTQYRLDLWRKTTTAPPTTTGRRGGGGKGTRGGSRRQQPGTVGTEEPA